MASGPRGRTELPSLWSRVAPWLILALLLFPIELWLIYALVPGPVTGRSLGYSVSGQAEGATTLAFEDPRCRREPDDRWNCFVSDPSGSGGGTSYEVEVNWIGCWTGERTGPARQEQGDEFPEEIDGCVSVGDSIRLGNRLLDAI